MESILKYLLHSIPLIAALIVWAVRLEKKITGLETDVKWIKKELPACQPSSVKPTR